MYRISKLSRVNGRVSFRSRNDRLPMNRIGMSSAIARAVRRWIALGWQLFECEFDEDDGG